jgi:histidyl-tRNA synthetase
MRALLPHVARWREEGLRVMCYPVDHKLKKQLNYANQIESSWVVFYGEEEMKKGLVSIKNMDTGSSTMVKPEFVSTSLGTI